MKLHYWGTAAAEGIPAIFCECDTCKEARKRGGKNLRTRSQALLDGKILIDFNADTYAHSLQYGISLHEIKHCLITHSHADHLYVDDVGMRKPGFSHLTDKTPLTFYSDTAGCEMLSDFMEQKKVSPETTARVVKITPGVPFMIEDYTVTPIRAAHDVKSSPVIFLIEKDGKSLLYGNDTSELPEDGMEQLSAATKKPIDCISLDCTEANSFIDYVGHLDIHRAHAFLDLLREKNIVDGHTTVILNHFSHNGADVLYEEFSEIAKKYGYLVSYDGMVCEI